ncbi:MAG: MBL fold metallo-hydrolase [Bacteroidota bacterium]
MNLTIHRGTQEIGGSCVELWTENTRILIDFGMPLVEKTGEEFDFNKYKDLTRDQLVEKGVLPNIKGLYKDEKPQVDGIIISHAHQDHYGLSSFINTEINFYLGEATHKIIELTNLFTPQNTVFANPIFFKKENTFQIGDFKITPYWNDHSAFDAYSFLVEANGKRIFYSGDFRSHGRKWRAYKWFLHNAPREVDYLLLEGSNVGQVDKSSLSEERIEDKLVEQFNQGNNINLIYTSGQNIDRLISIYKACLRANKTLVVDVYIAKVLKELSRFAKLPYPSADYKNLRVIFPYYTSKRLTNEGNKHILFQFKDYKITKEQVAQYPEDIVMIVRPSMQKDLDHIKGIDGGTLIYSMWTGYLEKSNTKKFIDYLKKRNFSVKYLHTSGHADTEALKEMVKAINPDCIIPIHTFGGKDYKKIFSKPVVELKDGEIRRI